MKRTTVLPALILALALTACGGPGATQTAAPTAAPTAVPTPVPTPEATPGPTPSPTPVPVLLAETEDMGQEYLDSIVFYGDSNTNGMRLEGVLPGGYGTTQIWTPMSGTLTLCNWSVDAVVYPETWTEMPVTEAMQTKQPAYLIVNLGVNGISFMDEEYFISEYTKMTEALMAANPDTKIMLSSLYPVAASYPYQRDINNEKLTAANGWIYDIAEKEGLRYIDCAAALRDADGNLPENLHSGDGLHLTAEGYRLVLDYIRCHGYA